MSPIKVEIDPFGVAVTPDGSKVYVANEGSGTISVINTTDNTVTYTVNVGDHPQGVAVTPDGTKIYVTKEDSSIVSVIDISTNSVVTDMNVEGNPIAFGKLFVVPSLHN